MSRPRYRVRWAETASRDLEEIAEFIAIDSRSKAERVLERIEARASRLESEPQRGRVPPELAQFGIRTWREILVRPYRLVYRLDGDTVSVLAVFDGRRDLEDVLLERLVRTP